MRWQLDRRVRRHRGAVVVRSRERAVPSPAASWLAQAMANSQERTAGGLLLPYSAGQASSLGALLGTYVSLLGWQGPGVARALPQGRG